MNKLVFVQKSDLLAFIFQSNVRKLILFKEITRSVLKKAIFRHNQTLLFMIFQPNICGPNDKKT